MSPARNLSEPLTAQEAGHGQAVDAGLPADIRDLRSALARVLFLPFETDDRDAQRAGWGSHPGKPGSGWSGCGLASRRRRSWSVGERPPWPGPDPSRPLDGGLIRGV